MVNYKKQWIHLIKRGLDLAIEQLEYLRYDAEVGDGSKKAKRLLHEAQAILGDMFDKVKDQ